MKTHTKACQRINLATSLLVTLLTTSCAITPEPVIEAAPTAPLVDEAPRPAPPRLIFAGFALHSQSKAFYNDVLSAEAFARKIDPNALMLKLGNPTRDQVSDWPKANVENFELVMSKIAEIARPEDRVVLLISTHANPGTLNINVAGKNVTPLTARGLSAALTPLDKTPTLIILSSCYSGNFIQPLRAPNRVILTATGLNRSSFKCKYTEENTFFADALFNQPDAGSLSITDWMGVAQRTILSQEKRKRLNASSPRIFIGPDAKNWANQPMSKWVETE